MNISESKYNMWRAIMAVMHLDGNLSKEEKKWGEKRIEHLKQLFNLNHDQVIQLNMDLEHGQVEFDDVIKKITDKSDLAFLIHQIRVVSNLDNQFSAEEKEKMKKVREMVLSKVNLNEVTKEVEELENQSYHEDEVYKVNNEHSIFEKAFKSLLKILNPGESKEP